ncbi:MAG: DUF3313 domain-containing protein [Gammaproteobacteria bacterium]|nr:DUF3313 domain-containing protein [Gammaproteobacteria bacterium]
MRNLLLSLLLSVVVVASGCASTTRARDVTESGFLGADYNLLEPGADDEAQERYIKPGVDWASYRNVLLEPVTLWRGKTAGGEDVPRKQAQVLTDYFYNVIKEALHTQGMQLVSTPQPHTLRVAVAVTKPEEANVGLNVMSSVVPQLHVISSLDKALTGKPAFVGQAQVEFKVTDAESGELLAAGIDHRIGGNVLNNAALSSWGQVEEMMRLWADHGSYNLCKRQGRSDCVAPKSS